MSEHLAWEIDGDGLEAVKLGDPRDDVRSVLGNFRSLKGPYDPARDLFVSQGVQVVYDNESRAREIMVDVPAQARLRGVDLLGRSLDDVLADLAAHIGAAISDAYGAVLPQMGISLYAVEGQVESVTIGYPPLSKPG